MAAILTVFAKGLRKQMPFEIAVSYCDGKSKPVFSFFEDFRGQISVRGALFCAGFDGHTDCCHDRPFRAQRQPYFPVYSGTAGLRMSKAFPLCRLESDESYFGPRRVRGRRGRGAGWKTVVFGLLKRDHQVYTKIVPNVTKAALQAVIRKKASLASILHTDKWPGYDGLVDLAANANKG
jgi:hypothetical protein